MGASGGIPENLQIRGKNVPITSLTSYGLLIIGLIVIYGGSYLSRPVVVAAAPTPSPSPTPSFEWAGIEADVSKAPHIFHEPFVQVGFANPGQDTEHIRWFKRIVFTTFYPKRYKEEIANLRASVKGDMQDDPDPGTESLPSTGLSNNVKAFYLPRLSSIQWNRWNAGADGIFYFNLRRCCRWFR